MIKKARTIVGHYKHSASATSEFHKMQEEMGLSALDLIQDCVTRWNSEYLMLDRLLKNKPVLTKHLSKLNIDNLTVNEWRLVEGYVEILQPLHEATVELSGERIPTASMVIPVLFSIQASLKHYNETHAGEVGSSVTFSKALLLALKARFPMYERQEPYFTAMLLDPRFKSVVVPNNEKQFAFNTLHQKLECVLKEGAESGKVLVFCYLINNL